MPFISLKGIMLNRPTWQLVQMSLAESAATDAVMQKVVALVHAPLFEH